MDDSTPRETDGKIQVSQKPQWRPSTLSVHADDPCNNVTDVAPPIHVATTYRYSNNPDELQPTYDTDVRPRALAHPS